MSNAQNYLETAFQPPIFLSQKQLDEGGPSLIGLVCGIGAIFVFYIALIALIKKNQETILKEKLAAERFVKNTHMMSESLFKPYLIGVKRIGTSWGKIISIFLLLAWIVSIIVITTGLQTISIEDDAKGNYAQIQAGLVLYFVALIGYFISRVLAYYKDKLEIRKKVRAHKKALARGMPDTLPRSDVPDSNPIRPSSLLSPVNAIVAVIRNSSEKDQSVDLTRRKSEKKFDQFFNYRRRIKHSTPVYQWVYFNTLNCIQILVLITEFLQLASFPVRDLFRSYSFLQSLQAPQGQSSLNFINGVRSLLSTFSTGLVSIDFNYVKFVLSWWLTVVAFVTAVLFTGFHYAIQTDYVSSRLNASHKRVLTNFLGGRWIVLTLPLINLFYLVILNAFLEPLSCLSSNNTPIFPVAFEDIAEAALKRIYQCYPIHTASPVMNTWYALFGFTIAFFLFSICRTANEPQPEDGIINYTSRSELWLKMSSISLLIIYALVPSQDTAAGRGILAILILIFMTLYNVIIGSTYSRWINFARTLSFLSTLWLSAVVAYYTDESRKFQLYLAGSGVWTVILVGWIVLWLLYIILDLVVIQKWENSCQDESTVIDVPEIMLEQGDGNSDGISEVSATSFTYNHGVQGPRAMTEDFSTNGRRASAGPRPMPSLNEQRGSTTSISSAKRGSLPIITAVSEDTFVKDSLKAPLSAEPLSTSSEVRTSLTAHRPPPRTPSPMTSPRPQRPSVGGSRPLPSNFVYKDKP